MKVTDFTIPVDAEYGADFARLRAKQYSDIIDKEQPERHQYVDLVMGGGGVLGIALVGYTYILEKVGIRFLNIGGTSAGSINALAMAAYGFPVEAKSERLIEKLAELDVWKFVDGTSAAKAVIKDFLGNKATFWKVLDIAREYENFNAHLGLNPGDWFRKWLSGVLQHAGTTTTEALAAKMRTLPASGLWNRLTGAAVPLEKADPHLGVVATDITTETKAVFPQMAPLYWKDWENVDPALYIRASMSIPFFFQPFRVNRVPQGDAAKAAWKDAVKNERFPPEECAFVDGGVLSNFPINMFHDEPHLPVTAPTFGVKLGTDEPPIKHFDRPVQLTMAIFNAARHALDNDFIARNPDFRQLVCTIDTEEQSWLNFDLTPQEKITLFKQGAKAAVRFLDGFRWDKYKETRVGMAEAHRAAGSDPGPEAAGPTPPA